MSDKTPDYKVADEIVAALLAANLVTAESSKDLAAKIADGRMTTLLWRTLLKPPEKKVEISPTDSPKL